MTDAASITPRAATLPEPETFDAPALARRLLRTARTASLATLDPAGDPTGHPFVSLTNIATDFDGAPVFIASRLALHSRNMAADGRVSLLLAPGGKGDPLAHPRLTLSGHAAPDAAPHLRRRFLARHPKAALYAELPDFAIWRVAVQGAHLIGGFGRAPDLAATDLLLDLAGTDALLDAEPDAVAHMNTDHAEAIALYATHFGGGTPGPWCLSGLDPEGLDLMLDDRRLRVCFPQQIADAGSLRATLARMAATARAAVA